MTFGSGVLDRIRIYKKELLACGYCMWHQYKRIRAIHRVIVASDNHILENSCYVHMEWFFGQFGNQPDTMCTLIGEIEPGYLVRWVKFLMDGLLKVFYVAFKNLIYLSNGIIFWRMVFQSKPTCYFANRTDARNNSMIFSEVQRLSEYTLSKTYKEGRISFLSSPRWLLFFF